MALDPDAREILLHLTAAMIELAREVNEAAEQMEKLGRQLEGVRDAIVSDEQASEPDSEQLVEIPMHPTKDC